MSHKTLKYIECEAEFVFTEGEQKFFAERDYSEPKRCKPCREAKKRRNEEKRAWEGRAPRA